MVTVNIDGAARGNPGPAGYGLSAHDSEGKPITEAFGFIGEQTNNFAEYCGLLAALELAVKKGWRSLHVKCDSELLVRQIRGEYKVKNEGLKRLHRRAAQLISRLNKFSIEHVGRAQNKEADKLANRAVDTEESRPKGINPILIKGSQGGTHSAQ